MRRTHPHRPRSANLARVRLATDNVFQDGATRETPVVSGSVSAGYEAALTVGVVP